MRTARDIAIMCGIHTMPSVVEAVNAVNRVGPSHNALKGLSEIEHFSYLSHKFSKRAASFELYIRRDRMEVSKTLVHSVRLAVYHPDKFVAFDKIAGMFVRPNDLDFGGLLRKNQKLLPMLAAVAFEYMGMIDHILDIVKVPMTDPNIGTIIANHDMQTNEAVALTAIDKFVSLGGDIQKIKKFLDRKIMESVHET